MHLRTLLGTAAVTCIFGTPCLAQTSGTPLEAGVMAPDFEIPGATRHGVLRDPIKLSDYHGKTVVLAFFYRARTRG